MSAFGSLLGIPSFISVPKPITFAFPASQPASQPAEQTSENLDNCRRHLESDRQRERNSLSPFVRLLLLTLAMQRGALKYKVLARDNNFSLSNHHAACLEFESNISGIKLDGSSFLIHEIYDDEMTFKLVAAASTVSGLPVEVCLEEFGKHFLVYCQTNGYDQILRVLGANLYDFLTNLDNLHDHLASIYPGMRAPSFRVTRHLNTNSKTSAAEPTCEQDDLSQRQQQQSSLLNTAKAGDELHKENASCSALTSSMYLHYYSERAGLSPIVKGLVMAVAREFFQTDIVVTECQMLPSSSSSSCGKQTSPSPSQAASAAAAAAAAATDGCIGSGGTDNNNVTNNDRDDNHHQDDHVVLKIDRRKAPAASEESSSSNLQVSAVKKKEKKKKSKTKAARDDNDRADDEQDQNDDNDADDEEESKSVMLNIYDSLSTNPRESLVNGEIMMQTFPFHVIFDRKFNLVQVGKSLLRVTSLFWQRTNQQQRRRRQQQQQTDDRRRRQTSDMMMNPSKSAAQSSSLEAGAKKDQPIMTLSKDPAALDGDCTRADEPKRQLVKFGDLFRIMRPKIEFTFDAIADHTNQVFVVKTRPLVLNADYNRQMKRLSSGSSSGSSSAGDNLRLKQQQQQHYQRPSICPFDRIAERRRQSALKLHHQTSPGAEVGEPVVNPVRAPDEDTQNDAAVTLEDSPLPPPPPPPQSAGNQKQVTASGKDQQQTSALDELGDPVNHLSLRLKGQMIVLLGGELCLYLCSPRVDHLDQLMECGVKMSDFALHDRARELMLMSHAHKEDREAVKKMDQASNDLKKMDSKLRVENERTNEVLHNIFPAKIASLLSHGHQVESESFELVTCLYSDIIGFTKMCGSENVKPIDIVRLLNTLYLQFDNLTNIHGVFKVETIGDAYVIVGGLPEPLEDHADRCVKMGLDMVKVIATVRSPADQQPIQMRIGIHSGPVMAGIVGIRVPRYSLFGNTTTLANQLETHGIGGKIHISDFTLKNLVNRDRFVIENNANLIGGIPFVTYFVTNYLGDKTETLKHEKILEEQLIKDYELRGDQLELVDEDQQLYTAAASAKSGEKFHNRPSDELDSLAESSKPGTELEGDNRSPSDKLAASLSSSASASQQQTDTGGKIETSSPDTQLSASDRSPPAAIVARAISRRALTSNPSASGSVSSAADKLLALEAFRVNFEDDQERKTPNQQQQQQQQLEKSKPSSGKTTASQTTKQRKPDKQLLMDVEDEQASQQFAAHLSGSIISCAIKQVSEMVEMAAELGQMRSSSSCPLRRHATDRPAATTVVAENNSDPSSVHEHDQDTPEGAPMCPFCEGCGRISAAQLQLQLHQQTSAQTGAKMTDRLLCSITEQRPDILEVLLGRRVESAAAELGPLDSANIQQKCDKNGEPESGLQLKRMLDEQYNKLQLQLDRISQQQVGLFKFQLETATRTTRLAEPPPSSPTKVPSLGLRRSSSEGTPAVIRASASKKTTVARPGAAGCSASLATGGGPLSSNIQRMKRMDTLKRRRLKKCQQSDVSGSSKVTGITGPDRMSSSSSSALVGGRTLAGDQTATARLDEADESSELMEEDEEEEEEASSPSQTTTNLAGSHLGSTSKSKVNTGNGIDGTNSDTVNNNAGGRMASAQATTNQVAAPGVGPTHRSTDTASNSPESIAVIDGNENENAAAQDRNEMLPQQSQPEGRKRVFGQSFLSAFVSSLSSAATKSSAGRAEMSKQRQQREGASRSRESSQANNKRSGGGGGCSCLRASDSSQSFNYMK